MTWDAPFAEGKTVVTATTKQLADIIARRNGVEGGPTTAPCLLGVDSVAGARRSTLGARSKTVRKAGKIFRTGILPAAAYDAPVWGMSDAECLRIRRLAAVAMSPRAGGRSLAMVHVWHGVPTVDAEHAPVIHCANLVWRVMTRREEAEMRGASLANISAQWHAAAAAFNPIVARYKAAQRTDGTAPNSVARNAWGEIKRAARRLGAHPRQTRVGVRVTIRHP